MKWYQDGNKAWFADDDLVHEYFWAHNHLPYTIPLLAKDLLSDIYRRENVNFKKLKETNVHVEKYLYGVNLFCPFSLSETHFEDN